MKKADLVAGEIYAVGGSNDYNQNPRLLLSAEPYTSIPGERYRTIAGYRRAEIGETLKKGNYGHGPGGTGFLVASLSFGSKYPGGNPKALRTFGKKILASIDPDGKIPTEITFGDITFDVRLVTSLPSIRSPWAVRMAARKAADEAQAEADRLAQQRRAERQEQINRILAEAKSKGVTDLLPPYMGVHDRRVDIEFDKLEALLARIPVEGS